MSTLHSKDTWPNQKSHHKQAMLVFDENWGGYCGEVQACLFFTKDDTTAKDEQEQGPQAPSSKTVLRLLRQKNIVVEKNSTPFERTWLPESHTLAHTLCF